MKMPNTFIPLGSGEWKTYSLPTDRAFAVVRNGAGGKHYVVSANELGNLLINGVDLTIVRTNKEESA